MDGTTLGLLVIVGIVIVALLAGNRKKPAPAPAPTPVPTPVTDDVTAPPGFYGVLALKNGSYVMEGDSLFFAVSYGESGCSPVAYNGVADNGTGPYEAKIEAHFKDGQIQPLFRADNDKYCSGQWIPCIEKGGATSIGGHVKWYPGHNRGWAAIEHGTSCNPDPQAVENGPEPVLPPGTEPMPIRFLVTVRNRFGKTTDPWPTTVWMKRKVCASGGGSSGGAPCPNQGGCNG